MPLTHAKDIDGRIKPAIQFDRGDIGTCEYCGAQVYRKTSINGLAYMALRAGDEHTHPTCKYLVSHSVAHTLKEFDLGQFLRNLPNDPPDEPENGHQGEPVEKAGPDAGGETNPWDQADNVGTNMGDQNPSEAKLGQKQEVDNGYELNCNSLRQIHEEDLLSGLTPNSHIHGKLAKNVFVIPRFLPEALNSKEFREGGERIIQCRARSYSEKGQKILFVVSKEIKKDVWFDGNFIVFFPSQTKWKQYFEQLYEEKAVENGTKKWEKKNKRLLIAAEWTKSKQSANYYMHYQSKKQIYIYDI